MVKIQPAQIARLMLVSNPYPRYHKHMANKDWFNWWGWIVESLPLEVLKELMYLVDPKEEVNLASRIIPKIEELYGDAMFGDVWKDPFAKDILAYRHTVKNYFRASLADFD